MATNKLIGSGPSPGGGNADGPSPAQSGTLGNAPQAAPADSPAGGSVRYAGARANKPMPGGPPQGGGMPGDPAADCPRRPRKSCSRRATSSHERRDRSPEGASRQARPQDQGHSQRLVRRGHCGWRHGSCSTRRSTFPICQRPDAEPLELRKWVAQHYANATKAIKTVTEMIAAHGPDDAHGAGAGYAGSIDAATASLRRLTRSAGRRSNERRRPKWAVHRPGSGSGVYLNGLSAHGSRQSAPRSCIPTSRSNGERDQAGARRGFLSRSRAASARPEPRAVATTAPGTRCTVTAQRWMWAGSAAPGLRRLKKVGADRSVERAWQPLRRGQSDPENTATGNWCRGSLSSGPTFRAKLIAAKGDGPTIWRCDLTYLGWKRNGEGSKDGQGSG